MIIRKRISLEFLGKEFKEAYLVFRSIPLKEYEQYIKDSDKIGDDGVESVKFLVKNLKEHFIEGKVPDDKDELIDAVADTLEDLDIESAIKVFSLLTGQELPPK